MSLFVSIPTSMQHIICVKSQSDRRICKFSFGSCNEVDVICYNRKDFVPPFDYNSVNEVLNPQS